jgi:hypothetical protein
MKFENWLPIMLDARLKRSMEVVLGEQFFFGMKNDFAIAIILQIANKTQLL